MLKNKHIILLTLFYFCCGLLFSQQDSIISFPENSEWLDDPINIVDSIEYDHDTETIFITKYVGGHSDVVMGASITNDEAIAEEMYRIQNSSGAVCGPMDSFLVLRGIKTLHLRVQRHCENGKKIAHFLADHPFVDKVYWPGFESHPNHHIAKDQMSGFGGMISFTLKGDDMELAKAIVSKTKIFTLAESLGGVESLIGHPSTMTHASIPREERIKSGVLDSLIRLSVGVEDASDLIEDLKEAFKN